MTVCYEIHDQEISHNSFDGEVIVVNLATGSYFSLHNTAAEVWQLLTQGPCSANSLAAAFTDATINACVELQAFLDQLFQQGLIVPSGAESVELQSSTPYSTPVLEVFDELRELLLADIIHDTDEQGWPHVAPDAAQDRAA